MSFSRRQLLVGAGASAGFTVLHGASRRLPRAWGAPPPSIVVVLADDMRYDYAPLLTVFHTDSWVRCTAASAQTPLCAPSRASLFTGLHAYATPVISNALASRMPEIESNTVATRLQAAGYRTALVGKYTNYYPWSLGPGYVPKGWSSWAARGSSTWKPAGRHETDYCFAWAADYIRATPANQPLFLWVAPWLPHEPSTPPARYATARVSVPPEPPSVDEADVSDKPAWVQAMPRLTADQFTAYRLTRLNQARAMLAIDEGMRSLVRALKDTGRWNSTMVIFTSDNSLSLGEHRLWNKDFPYEDSAHVPFFVHVPGVARRSEWRPVSLVDVPTTACALARAPWPHRHGVDLLPLLSSATRVREGCYLTGSKFFRWSGVRQERYKYVEKAAPNGFRELYDLQSDPYELRNIIDHPAHGAAQERLTRLLAKYRSL